MRDAKRPGDFAGSALMQLREAELGPGGDDVLEIARGGGEQRRDSVTRVAACVKSV